MQDYALTIMFMKVLTTGPRVTVSLNTYYKHGVQICRFQGSNIQFNRYLQSPSVLKIYLAGEMCLVDTSMMSTNFEVFVTYNTKTRGHTMFGNAAGNILHVSGYHDCNQLTSIHIWALIWVLWKLRSDSKMISLLSLWIYKENMKAVVLFQRKN